MALKKPQKSLKSWTKQKWRTKSGKPSTQGSKATGERYLPEKAIKALTAKEYAATTKKKRKATKKGKQVSKQPKKIAKKNKEDPEIMAEYKRSRGVMKILEKAMNAAQARVVKAVREKHERQMRDPGEEEGEKAK